MNETTLKRLLRADIIRLLLEAKAREEDLEKKHQALSVDFARANSNRDLAESRARTAKEALESARSASTAALNEANRLREVSFSYQKAVDNERALREQMAQRIEDMRTFLDVVKAMAGRE